MAKSAWKFFNFNSQDIDMYLDVYILKKKYQGLQYYGLVHNSFKLNTINYMHYYKFHQGQTYNWKRFCSYNIGAKGYEFLKFKKPFYFYSKKKNK